MNDDSGITDPTDALFATIEADFPHITPALDAALSGWAALLVVDISLPCALFFVGPPSSQKTVVIDLMKIPSESVYVDDFSPASFVTHMAGPSEEQLRKIDLLPKLKGKLFLTPELNTIWTQARDKLIKNIGTITRVLDGEGYTSNSGVHGKRGYDEPIMFVWLGATTPIPRHIWPILGKLGSRLYFFPAGCDMPDKDRLIENIQNSTSFADKKKRCRDAVAEFMASLRQQHPEGFSWDKSKDDKLLIDGLSRCAELLSKLRGHMELYYDKSGDAEISSPPLIEGYDRATQWFYNIARGHALIHGRTRIAKADLKLIAKIALSSAPYERVQAVRILAYKPERTLEEFAAFLGCTKKPAMRIARVLETLGLVELDSASKESSGRPPATINLKKEYRTIVQTGSQP